MSVMMKSHSPTVQRFITSTLPFAESPSWRLFLMLMTFLFAQAVSWTLLPAFVTTALPLNTAELAAWSHAPFIVNYKHPGLIVWLMWFAYRLFGTHEWVVYAVAQCLICGTYVFVYLLGRDLFGPRRAFTGTLLLSSVGYFTLSALKLNHNIVQMPFWAAFCWALWRASNCRSLFWWTISAAIAALGLYAKFSTALLIAAGAFWLLLDRDSREQLKQPLRFPATYVALMVFVILLAPLAINIAWIDYLPLKWIAAESAAKGVNAPQFIISQIALICGPIIFIHLCGFLRFRDFPFITHSAVSNRQIRYLSIMAGGPLIVVLLLSCFSKMRIEWTTPMFNLVGLALVSVVPHDRLTDDRLSRLAKASAGVSLAVLLIFGTLCFKNRRLDDNPWIVNWPQQEVSHRFYQLWSRQFGQGPKYIGGATYPAAIAGLQMPSQPILFSRLDPSTAPDISADNIQQNGILVIWNADGSGWQPDARLLNTYEHGVEHFSWSPKPKRPTIDLGYLLVPPRSMTNAQPNVLDDLIFHAKKKMAAGEGDQ